MATLRAIQEPSARISGLSHVADRLEVVDVINKCCLSRFAASALGLHCLHNTPEGIYGLEMVKVVICGKYEGISKSFEPNMERARNLDLF